MYKDETPPTETTVVVVAPSNLHEGYTFDVTHNGRTFSVTVPEGGVVAVKHSMRSFLLLSHLLLSLMERMLIYQLKSLQ